MLKWFLIVMSVLIIGVGVALIVTSESPKEWYVGIFMILPGIMVIKRETLSKKAGDDTAFIESMTNLLAENSIKGFLFYLFFCYGIMSGLEDLRVQVGFEPTSQATLYWTTLLIVTVMFVQNRFFKGFLRPDA